MCDTCGCAPVTGVDPNGAGTGTAGGVRLTPVGPPARDGAGHDHPHAITLERDVLSRNDDLAARNRAWLDLHGVTAVNVMSSPGSGKTTLLERTVADLVRPPEAPPVSVIEGDQETLLDARRLAAAGARTVQVNTGAGCHLDAAMVARALPELAPPPGSTVFVENVGNLVCPALFDLGEHARAVLMSVTEGADKPLKYPHMFRRADVVLINKIDLLPHVDFDVAACREAARRVSPGVRVLLVSAARGDGIPGWCAWLRSLRRSGEPLTH
ncbi:hydrogenase nickel incorporation protein HypB [Actinomadura roseirufa]|uniref:hydrogenase nickel incorporation protein HypB n=1 Tax=Actinomadura roseirufa TaxID=2094049 RepID=UPI001040E1AE|nr:hydrogenase nickel incorporation protein HypB [Actinomadura roseirufa]